jgi:hypothetical protein
MLDIFNYVRLSSVCQDFSMLPIFSPTFIISIYHSRAVIASRNKVIPGVLYLYP